MNDEERARFWEKVSDNKRSYACWQWLASRDVRGYGMFRVGGHNMYAHKAAYEDLVGPVPVDHVLSKTCGRGSCVNPAHHKVTPRKGAGRKPGRAKSGSVDKGDIIRPPSTDWMRAPGG